MAHIINMKTEVESVLGRALIGHEKAIVAHLRNNGMMNPVDVARTMLQRHLENNSVRMIATQTERDEIKAELVKLDWTLVEAGKEA